MKSTNLFLWLILACVILSCKDDDINVNEFRTSLDFTPLFSFENSDIHEPGMIASKAENSIFIATREGDYPNNSELVLKVELSSKDITEKLYPQDGLVTKQLHIVDDRLLVVGGTVINSYDLNLSEDPISVSHGKRLSRFGSVVQEDKLYLIGGDFNDVESAGILQWDLDRDTLVGFSILPERRSGARGTIVNGYMYVFGGSKELFGVPTNTIYRVNMNNPFEVGILEMNKAINWTYVHEYETLIYVAGRIEDAESQENYREKQHTIGVFNSLNNTYQELTTNLVNSTGFESIRQMCILDDKMYILFGDERAKDFEEFNTWQVLVCDLF